MRQCLLLITVLVACGPLWAQDSASEFFQKGVTEFQEGHYGDAVVSFTQAIKMSPDYAEAYVNRATCFDNLKEYQNALSDYDTAIIINPNIAETYYDRGSVYDELGDHRNAISDYSKAIELKPDFPQAYYNRALAHSALQDYKQALEDYGKAIHLQPDYGDAFFNRGNTYFRLENFHEAKLDYLNAIRIDPSEPDVYDAVGYEYLQEGKTDSALISFSKCLDRDKQFWDADLGLAIVNLERADTSGAKLFLSNARTIESRLSEGMKGIEKLESEGWIYSANTKAILERLFDAVR